jgi:hypothetical protein
VLPVLAVIALKVCTSMNPRSLTSQICQDVASHFDAEQRLELSRRVGPRHEAW